MSITFRKKVKLSKSYGIKDSMDYISNASKSVRRTDKDDLEGMENEFKTLDDVINYAKNEAKTKDNAKQYCFSRNCDVETATKEMEDLLKKYDQYKEDKTVLYHTVVSFAYTDPITPEQMVEYGKELLKEYYGNYMSVGYCHINAVKDTNRGAQYHFHILTSACDLNGKRLRDDFYGKEGLSELRNVCDRLSAKYGCEVIINEKGSMFHSKKRAYYSRDLQESQKSQILKAINELSKFTYSVNELMEMLQLEYSADIEWGKDDISITFPGFERPKRLSALGTGYSLKELNKYYYQKRKGILPEDTITVFQRLKDKDNLDIEDKQYYEFLEKAYESVEDRLNSPRMSKAEFKKMKIQEEIQNIIHTRDIMDKFGITDRDKYEEALFNAERKYRLCRNEYNSKKKELCDILETKNLLKNYLALYSKWRDYDQGYVKYKSDDVEMFEMIRNVLETEYHFDTDLDSIRKAYQEADKKITETQDKLKELSQLRDDYNTLKRLNVKLEKDKYKDEGIKTIDFTEKNIIKQEGKTVQFRLPYLKDFAVEVPIKSIVNEYSRYNYFVIDEEPIDLLNMEGKYIATLKAKEVFEMVQNAKDDIAKTQSENGQVELEHSTLSVPLGMIDFENSNEFNYLVRKPFRNQYMSIPADRIIIGNDKAFIDLAGYGTIDMYNSNGEIQKPRYLKYLKEELEKEIAKEHQKQEEKETSETPKDVDDKENNDKSR